MTEPESVVPLAPMFYRRACWRDVFFFLKVVEAGSFRQGSIEAKTALNTAREGVSRLERLARTPLLERSIQGVVMTPAGEKLFEIARGIETIFVRAATGRTPFPDIADDEETTKSDAPPEGGAPNRA